MPQFNIISKKHLSKILTVILDFQIQGENLLETLKGLTIKKLISIGTGEYKDFSFLSDEACSSTKIPISIKKINDENKMDYKRVIFENSELKEINLIDLFNDNTKLEAYLWFHELSHAISFLNFSKKQNQEIKNNWNIRKNDWKTFFDEPRYKKIYEKINQCSFIL